jgi:hypothetical protein
MVDSNFTCYRHGNLVYFKSLKCASTFYLNLFDTHLNWQKIGTNDINWATDRVFSHIRNPINKRNSGMAEYFTTYVRPAELRARVAALLDDDGLVKVVGQSPYYDPHNLSFHDMLGDYAELVDWIPIDVDVDHVSMTMKLLSENGIKLTGMELTNLSDKEKNISTGNKKKICDQLTKVDLTPLIKKYLDYDFILYNHVVDFFNPSGNNWDEISWLKFHNKLD